MNLFHQAAEILAKEYGNRHNLMEVETVDTLVHVLLAVRSTVERARSTFAEIKVRWPTWTEFIMAKEVDILPVLHPLGMSQRRLRIIKTLLRTVSSWDQSVMQWGPAVVGVGPKVARCAALYAEGAAVVPLDTHGLRVSRRLMRTCPTFPSNVEVRELVEEGLHGTTLHYSYHMNAMMLGRHVCTPHVPQCESCCLKPICRFGNDLEARSEEMEL